MPQAKPRITVVSAAIERGGCYLITQRKPQAVLPLLWEFPGGKVEPGESDAEALRRELRYRLGIEATVGERVSTHERDYQNYTVVLHLYRCELGAGEPRAVQVNEVRWVTSAEFERFEFTPADQASMDALLFAAEAF